MDNLKSLIPVSYDNPERPTVSGRELHDFLEVTTRYNDWFNRMTEYGFTDGHMICAKMGRVDGSAIRENVYYTLKNGEFVEADP